MQAENSGTSSKSARAQFLLAGEETKTPSESLAQRSEHSSKRRRVEVSPENDRYAWEKAALLPLQALLAFWLLAKYCSIGPPRMLTPRSQNTCSVFEG